MMRLLLGSRRADTCVVFQGDFQKVLTNKASKKLENASGLMPGVSGSRLTLQKSISTPSIVIPPVHSAEGGAHTTSSLTAYEATFYALTRASSCLRGLPTLGPTFGTNQKRSLDAFWLIIAKNLHFKHPSFGSFRSGK